MAKNTNPLTKNLLIKQNWNTISLPITGRVKHGSNEFVKDRFIKDLINGSFLKLGILTSEISLTKICTGENTLQFLYYPLINTKTKTSNQEKIIGLIQILKRILNLREPTKDYKFVCVKAANKFVEGKILNDYINYMVIEDPSRLKNVVNTLIKEYKTLSIKKYDSIINKSKYSG